jgi:molybdopterin/thiamine biosynthesis adenylyltransferase
MSSLAQPKVDVLAAMAKDINPEVEIRIFKDGVAQHNLADFLSGADLFVDGLDYFALDMRQAIFASCANASIPAITAAPLGMGAAILNFLPGKMSFKQYFHLDDLPPQEQALRFLIGLSPSLLQRTYLVDRSRVDLGKRRGPSTTMACQLCAGMAATEALKILLKRGKVRAAPFGFHFDAYRNQFATTWRPFGNNNPLQRISLMIARRQLKPSADSAAQ